MILDNTSIYIVQTVDSDGNITSEMFNNDRERAIQFLKYQHAVIRQNHKDWDEEVGINYFAWQKGNHSVKLYLKILEETNVCSSKYNRSKYN